MKTSLRVRNLITLWTALVSLAWLSWTWNDTTLASWTSVGRNEMREQTQADHVAAILFAVARIVVGLIVAEFVRAGLAKKEAK